MAGLGKKTFTAGEVLTAADVNGYLMEQSVMVFGGTAARSSAIPTPSEGMVTYLSDLNDIQAYNGSNWISTGLTAGTTTANYGWPIPASGSIASLGTAIDTTVAGLGSGLNLITTASFTTQTDIQVDNCFSSTYDNYKVIFTMNTASVDNSQLRWQLVDGTTPTTTGYYYGLHGLNFGNATAVTEVSGGSGAASVIFGRGSTNGYMSAVMDILRPQLAQRTNYNVLSNSGPTNAYYGLLGSGWQDSTTQFEGIKFFANSGNVTGTYWIYGYDKA